MTPERRAEYNRAYRAANAALVALNDAYYAIPAGQTTDEEVIECLPDLYRAIDCVLAAAGTISGLLAVVGHATEQGYPIHVATRTTCAEHLEHGDDQKSEFAFGQPAERSV